MTHLSQHESGANAVRKLSPENAELGKWAVWRVLTVQNSLDGTVTRTSRCHPIFSRLRASPEPEARTKLSGFHTVLEPAEAEDAAEDWSETSGER